MKPGRIVIIGGALAGGAWLAFAAFGSPFAHACAGRFGDAIIRGAMGNVSDPAHFVLERCREVVLLFTAGVAIAVIHALVDASCLRPKNRPNLRWAVHAVLAFALANAWLALAENTTVAWALCWQGRENTHNLARFEIKRRLLREYAGAHKIAIVGSSQARAQLDEQILNDQLGTGRHAGELHFPSARSYDLVLLHRRIGADVADTLVCYVSEMDFYCGPAKEVVPFFFGWSDIKDCARLDLLREFSRRELGYGLLGRTVPAFELRDMLARRLLGDGLSGIRQRQHDAGVRTDLDASARRMAVSFQIDSTSDFQKRCFTEFVEECERQHQKLVLVAGQLNPRLSRRLAPEIRMDMLNFLQGLGALYTNVHVIDDCPAQGEGDYVDLTHVSEVRQKAFTEFIAQRLGAGG